MTHTIDENTFYSRTTDLLKGACEQCSFVLNEFTVILSSPDHLGRCVTFLRDHKDCLFNQLIDITAVDYPNQSKRFEMVYHFLSMPYNKRLRLKYTLHEGQAAPSLTPIFESANWYEREVYDLFGIMFENHPDLRRILTDYNFEGHPLRKDFPLTGYYEVRYDDTEKNIVYEPVVLPQAFREFDNLSPWEGMNTAAKKGFTRTLSTSILPGDEKASTQPSQKER